MPIYGYECAACGHVFDRLQKLSDPDPEVCPACAAAAVKRQLTAPSFRLSGSGWYETDFKKDGEKKRNLSGSDSAGEGKPEAKSETKSETKSDAKPEAKSESKSEVKTAAPAAPAAPSKPADKG
jgi:putative FmdB family regulatory protein